MPIHKEVLEAARRLCAERKQKTFRVVEVVHALPHLSESSVRTHIVSRCCVNAPKHHPHRWPYFRRVARGEYEIVAPRSPDPGREKQVKETSAVYSKTAPLKDTIHVAVHRSEGFYVGECLELALVTQGRSLDELLTNLKEAIGLHLEGEAPGALGVVDKPRLALTYEELLISDAKA